MDKKAPPTAEAVGAPSIAPPTSTTTKSAAGNTKKKRGSSKQPSDSNAAKKKKKDTPAPAVDTATKTTATVAPAAKKASVPVTKISGTSSVNSGATSTGGMTNISDRPLLDQVLYRLTEGIPQTELKAVVREADECEKALLKEIQMLEDALKEERENPSALEEAKNIAPVPAATTSAGASDSTVAVNIILESPLTPLDRAFTLSSLLGRLRDELALPSIRKPLPAAVAVAAASKKKKANANPAPTYPQLVALADHSNYTREHTVAPATNISAAGGQVIVPTAEQHAAQLLHVWRKIASHRTAMVFRRPVKPEEAPGYTDRILFPMDLSLVRKMIVSRILTTYSEVHQMMRLISHNCVKYNGRYVQPLDSYLGNNAAFDRLLSPGGSVALLLLFNSTK